MEDINSPINAVGISRLIDPGATDARYQLDKIEKDLIGGKLEMLPNVDPKREVQRIMQETDTAVPEDVPLDGGLPNNTAEPVWGDDADLSSQFAQFEPAQSNHFNSPPSQHPPNHFNSPPPQPNQSPQLNQSPQFSNFQNRPGILVPPRAPPNPLDEAMKDYSGVSLPQNWQEENEDELIAAMLEDIEDIREELVDHVKLDSIPKVNNNSPPQLIKQVHEMLRRKHERYQCSTMGKEMILLIAKGLGWIFNGKRQFGPVRPNLRGWHTNVRPRLKSMRYETGAVTSRIMRKLNIGEAGRIFFELVPSAILYSAAMSDQEDEPGYSPDQMSEAMDDLAQYETKI